MIGFLIRAWKARWNAARWVIAAFLLWTALIDTGARLARLELAALPDYDAAAEIARLRGEARFGEAIVLADAAIGHAEASHAPAEKTDRLRRERELTIAEQTSVLRRAKDVGLGALTGGAGVEPGRMSIEMLVGAIATDMLVVGDVRDLIIQGYDYAVDGKADPVIVALSAIGIATTLAPEVDWAPALLKIARKVGAVGEHLGGFIVKTAKAGKVRDLKPLLEDSAALARRSSPGTAVRLLRLADSPDDVARMTRFLERQGAAGAAALHATGEAGAATLRVADELRIAGKIDDAALLESVIVRAGSKGTAGATWLKRGGYAALVRPHPLVGALKGVYKGTAGALVQKTMESFDAKAWWIVPLIAGWAIVESALLWRSLLGPRAAHPLPANSLRSAVVTAPHRA